MPIFVNFTPPLMRNKNQSGFDIKEETKMMNMYFEYVALGYFVVKAVIGLVNMVVEAKKEKEYEERIKKEYKEMIANMTWIG